MPSDDHAPPLWRDFHNGGLLLPLPNTWFTSVARSLEWQGLRLHVKKEFHATLLNQTVGSRVRDALGQAQVKRLFEDQDWALSRSGYGALLHKQKVKKRPAGCASVIEHISLPSLERFRASVARTSGIELPDVPAHVTLYVVGNTAGIGLPSQQTLVTATVATLRLPGIANRSPPPLEEQQQAAYCAANYALDALETSVRIGARCPIIDAELVRRGVDRATVITAFNPFSTRADAAGNELRQQWLLAALDTAGLEAIEAEGRDPEGHWAPEPSLLAFGTTRELEDRLLRDFEQHAVVVVERDAPARLVLHPDQTTGR